MIVSFADKDTELVFSGRRSRKFPPQIQDKAIRLLRQMNSVRDWNDLRHPPGNKLHKLYRDRTEQYAIWINDQWRIAFQPVDGALANVEITDYHD